MKKLFQAPLSVIASPSLGEGRGNLIKNSSMGIVACCLAILAILTGCAQRERWATYTDSMYPVTAGYTPDPKKMTVNAKLIDEKDPLVIKLKLEPGYTIDVDADFSEIDGNHETLEHVYTLDIYKYERDFKEYVSFDSRQPIKQEKNLNGTPAIFISDPAKPYETYILLVPGIYNRVVLKGLGRSEKITREALAHFHWTQPIDTTTPEFKAWKAHILEILKTPKQK